MRRQLVLERFFFHIILNDSMVKFCKSCNIPRMVSRDQTWLPNGSIVAKKVPTFRLLTLEMDRAR